MLDLGGSNLGLALDLQLLQSQAFGFEKHAAVERVLLGTCRVSFPSAQPKLPIWLPGTIDLWHWSPAFEIWWLGLMDRFRELGLFGCLL